VAEEGCEGQAVGSLAEAEAAAAAAARPAMWCEIEARVNASTHLIEVHTHTHRYTAAAAVAAVFTEGKIHLFFPLSYAPTPLLQRKLQREHLFFLLKLQILFIPSCACGAAFSSSSIQQLKSCPSPSVDSP
jgi:hypothetical protein